MSSWESEAANTEITKPFVTIATIRISLVASLHTVCLECFIMVKILADLADEIIRLIPKGSSEQDPIQFATVRSMMLNLQ